MVTATVADSFKGNSQCLVPISRPQPITLSPFSMLNASNQINLERIIHLEICLSPPEATLQKQRDSVVTDSSAEVRGGGVLSHSVEVRGTAPDPLPLSSLCTHILGLEGSQGLKTHLVQAVRFGESC